MLIDRDNEIDQIEALHYHYGMMTFKSKQRSQLSVGDIIIVQKDEEVPADLLLLRAKDNSAQLDQKILDGELTLKQKQPFISNISDIEIQMLKGSIYCQLPDNNINYWQAKIYLNKNSPISLSIQNLLLKGSFLRANSWILGIVVHVGRETKIQSNNRRQKKLNFSNMLSRNMLLLISIIVLLSIILTSARSIYLHVYNVYPYHYKLTNHKPVKKQK